ncbi:MAG TPA: HEPN domain-containing protein [Candidatus Methylomirabilis sp.]|nr:HEPN domain-containing protein [Candidatus Methylomirabilis sp.]
MSGPSEQLRALQQWVGKAEHDLRNAEYTLTLKEDCPFDTVCFHCQQCVEKYLKALLIAHAIDPPKIHDLGTLWKLIPSEAGLGLEASQIVPLNRYTVEARYPGDWEEITRAAAEVAVAIAREAREAVRACLPPEALRSDTH